MMEMVSRVRALLRREMARAGEENPRIVPIADNGYLEAISAPL